MRRSWMIRVFALSVALVVLAGGNADAQVEPEPVVTGRAEQYFGSANDTYLAYTQWTRRAGERALARLLGGGSVVKLNAPGTEGNTGGFDPGTNRIILQQYRWETGRSDLFFYDLDTGERSKVPGVNTRRWEYRPRISSTFIAFARALKREGKWYASILVHDRLGGETRKLGEWREGPPLFVSSAGDQFVTFTRCTNRNCFAYIYEWATDTLQTIPTVNGKPQYMPVVDEVNSSVYFARSGRNCGQDVDIWRLPLPLSEGDTPTHIVELPAGIDTGFTASLTANAESGQMDLYFERWDCTAQQNDIYVARGVDAEPAP